MAGDDINRGPNANEPDEQDGGAKRFIVPVVLALALAGAGYFVYSQMGKGSSGGQKRQTVKIAVLPDTPPPPPPPPKDEKKPEPKPDDNKPQPQEQPKQVDTPPEPQQLKMEGAAGDGPSAFGSGTVNSEYKGGPIGNGTGGEVGGKLQFALFNGQLQRHVQSSMARNPKAKVADYRVNVQVWVSPTGELRVDLLSSTGDEKSDEVLRQALSQLPPIQNVPSNLAQPIRLRITNRMTG